MRIYHRYLGFFVAGIMAVYSISGVVLIFRDTDFLKKEYIAEKQLEPGLDANEVGREIKIKNLKFSSRSEDLAKFERGTYNTKTGLASYTVKRLPLVLDKMTHLHKAKSSEPLFFLNIFFGVALLFLVISSFWMFLRKTPVFKKGMYFAIAGIVLTLVLLFV
ncbi:hypothetical protein [Maribacter sp. 2210JD10-5]|uniref:hypothetical protein n=1 Tax=Maribacter sp. 2210JD10-5 TaxID=3386272 RepID=UPI0039BD0153